MVTLNNIIEASVIELAERFQLPERVPSFLNRQGTFIR
jgi:hypothetical protein